MRILQILSVVRILLIVFFTSCGLRNAEKTPEQLALQRTRQFLQFKHLDHWKHLEYVDNLLDACSTPMCLYTKAVVSFELKKEQPDVAERYIRSAVRQNKEMFLPALVWILIEKGDNERAFNLLLQIRDESGIENKMREEEVYSIPSRTQLFVRLCKSYDDHSGICTAKMGHITRQFVKGLTKNDAKNIAYGLASYYNRMGSQFAGLAWSFAREGNDHSARLMGVRERSSELPEMMRKELLFPKAMKDMFDESFLKTFKTWRNSDGSTLTDISKPLFHPIFIVGLPRSGTSLLEQILCTHSKIECVGETEIISEIMPTIEFRRSNDFVPRFQEGAVSLDSLADTFFKKVKARHPNVASASENSKELFYFTEKTNQNFRSIPFIEGVFGQGATIINVLRNRADVYVSIFMNSFASRGMIWATRAEWIERYFIEYDSMIASWRKIGAQFIDISYEDLVSSPETVISGLLNQIGTRALTCGIRNSSLVYEPDMLRFHQLNGRFAHTVSSLQVKKGITTNLGKYEKYARFIPANI